ncbi:hypothetical protein [Streptomyces sp. NPDC002088]|uniref:hypothetical protein n=1 Tax=Streptomyces sp. NPDC002088 TaxID=3154665 RepID=UPI003320ED9F
MTVMDLPVSPSRAPTASPPAGHAGPLRRAVLVLDGAALSHTRFMVSPLNELLARAALHSGAPGPLPDRSHRYVLQRLTSALRTIRRPVADLFSPALLDRTNCPAFEEELEALRALMTGRAEPRPPVSAEDAGELIDALRAAFGLWLGESWPARRRDLTQDVAFRAHQLARHGMAWLLDHLHDEIGYADQVLYLAPPAPATPPRHTAEGLLLAPSAVASRPALLTGGDVPVLRYPYGARTPHSDPPTAAEQTPLASLLGRARSHALGSIGTGCSTTELAGRLGVGAATASSHAAALRRAGLIVTHRRGKQVEHLMTELGSQLLTAGHG